jgi:hypothetical protein
MRATKNRAAAPAAGLQIATDITLPIDAVTQRFAWMGRTGSGKTYAAMKLAELMLDAGAQIVVFDIPGHWAGLRLGPTPFEIPVFGGTRGDIPLEPAGGAAVADLVVSRGISAVLDVSQMDDDELWRFTADFTARFFVLKQSAPSAVHVFFDECQELVPQEWERGQKDAFRAIHRLQKRGRSLGIGTSLISPRPQEVSKKVLNQAECVFAFQMTGKLERDAIADWAAATGADRKNISQSLAALPVGQAHVFSPQWLGISTTTKIAKKRSPDVSATPKVGDRKESPKALSPVDLQDLRVSMDAAIERAKQADPKELRQRISELEAELRTAKEAIPPTRVEVPVLTDEDRAAVADLLKQCDAISELGAKLRSALAKADVGAGVSASLAAVSAPARDPRMPAPRTNASHGRHARPANATGGKLGGGERKILIALAQYPNGRTKKQVAILTGYAANGGAFNNYLSALRRKGFIRGRDVLTITESGLSALGSFDPLPAGQALRDYWMQQLGKAERSILAVLCDAYPRTLTKEALAAGSGYEPAGGGFSNALSRLRTLELLQGRGEMVAAAELF